MRYTSVVSILFLLFSVLVAPSHGAVSCHCFQDRTYDPSRPSAADIYFLATTQNSLMSAAFNIPKRSIVQAKMGGADADLLWLSYYISDRSGLDVTDMLETWTTAGLTGLLAKLEKLKVKFDKPFLAALRPGADLSQLAQGACRSVLVAQLGVDGAILEGLEFKGANRQEQILALFISFLLAEDAVAIYSSVRSGQQTWGQMFASTGLDAGQIEASWRKLMKLYRDGLN